MKKLLIFMLVFGLASIASAVPVMKLGTTSAPFDDANQVIEITGALTGYELYVWGSSDLALEYDSDFNIIPSSGVDIFQIAVQFSGGADLQTHSITKFTAVSGNPFGTTTVAGRAYDGTDKIKGALLNVDGVDAYGMSKFFRLILDVTADGGDVTFLQLASPLETYTGNTVAGSKYRGFGSVTFIPEPATIVLLGLGGLLLRRRK